MKLRVIIISCIFLVSTGCNAVLAQDIQASLTGDDNRQNIDKLNSELANIQKEIGAKQQQLAELKDINKNFKISLQKTQKTLEQVVGEKKQITKFITLNEEKLKKTEYELISINKQKEDFVKNFSKRLRELYFYKNPLTQGQLVEKSLISGMYEKPNYNYELSQFVINKDLKILEKFYQISREQQAVQQTYTSLNTAENSLLTMLENRHKMAVKIAGFKQDLIKRNSRYDASLRDVVASLNKEVVRIESLIAEVTGVKTSEQSGFVQAGSLRSDSSDRKQSSEAVVMEDQKQIQQTGFVDGIKLRPPVIGSIIQRFGKKKSLGLGAYMPSKGIEFSTKSQEEVLAVLPGIVRYVGVIPGYENTVIIDHGKRYFTLYGKLSMVEAKQGDSMVQGQKIGLVSTDDDKGKMYFEVRHEGSPVNPAKFLSLN